ncbi:MAG: hypothetical protein AABO57_09295 [Acidobacteriota bacterium]
MPKQSFDVGYLTILIKGHYNCHPPLYTGSPREWRIRRNICRCDTGFVEPLCSAPREMTSAAEHEASDYDAKRYSKDIVLHNPFIACVPQIISINGTPRRFDLG